MSDDGYSIEGMLLEANIREFAHKISIICALEQGGKLSSAEAYEQIKQNWRQLKQSRKALLSGAGPDQG